MKKLILLFIIAVPTNLWAGEKNEQFKILEKNISTNQSLAIAALLLPYGALSEFVVTDESIISEICSRKSVMHAKVTCEKSSKILTQLHYAEGKGLLCEITDNYMRIRCLRK